MNCVNQYRYYSALVDGLVMLAGNWANSRKRALTYMPMYTNP